MMKMPINGMTWRALLHRNVVSCLLIGLGIHIENYLMTNRTPINIVYLKKTGCFVTIDRSDVNLIQSESLKDYEAPLIAVIQLAVNTQTTIKIEQSEDVEDDDKYDLEIETEEEREILIFDDQ